MQYHIRFFGLAIENKYVKKNLEKNLFALNVKSNRAIKAIFLMGFFTIPNLYTETWKGTFGNHNVDLKASEQKEVTIVSSNVNSNRGNNFGYNDRSHFSYSTNGTTSSTLTLKADSSMNNLQFYLEGGMSIGKLSNLIIDYAKASSGGSPNTFLQTSSINIAGSFSIRLVDTYSIQGEINVDSNGRLNIEAKNSIRNGYQNGEAKIINDGGEISLGGVFYNNSNYVVSSYSTTVKDFGVVENNKGKIIFTSDVYNTGVRHIKTTEVESAKIINNGGEIEIRGNLENGGGYNLASFDSGFSDGQAGIGYIIGTGGSIKINGNLVSKAQEPNNNSFYPDSPKFDQEVRSKIDLTDTTLSAANIYNEARSDILLSGSAKMTTSGTFESKKDSSITFIGTQNGFGSIEAGTLKLDGEENYQIRVLKKTNDYKYFIASGTSVTGLTEGEIEIKDANGNKSDLYKAKLVKETNNTKESWYIKLTKLPATPNAPSKPDQTPSDDDIFGDIIFVTQDSLNKANDALNNQASILNTIPQNIDIFMGWTTMLDRSTVMLSKALSSNTKPISIALLKKAQKLANKGQINPQEYRSDAYTNSIIQLESPYKKASFYANIMGGINGYKNSLGYGYGVNLGFDGYGSDDFFGGVFLSLERYDIKAQDLRLDSIHYRLGSYMRARASKVEFDGLLEYIYAPSEYKRVLPINGISTYSDASYHTQALDAQLRIGPRFGGDSSFKPYMGVLLEYYHTPSFKESGGLNLDVSKNAFLHLSGILGFEYRKLFDASSLYLALEAVSGAIIAGDKYLSLTRNNTTIDFKNANNTYGNFILGGNIFINETFSLHLSLNTKASLSGFYGVNAIFGGKVLF